MNSYKQFETIGLIPRDMHVYEILYQRNDASLRTIAGLTGLNRGTVYEVVKKLTNLGLVTFKEQGERRRYVAADPQVLSSLVKERMAELSYFEPQISTYTRHLEALRSAGGASHFAQFYEGDEGVSAILRDVLQTLEAYMLDNYCVVSSKDISALMYTKFKTFTRRRVQRKLFVRVLADADSETANLAERRKLPPDRFFTGGYMILYAHKVALITRNETNELTGVVLDNQAVSAIHHTLFDACWREAL